MLLAGRDTTVSANYLPDPRFDTAINEDCRDVEQSTDPVDGKTLVAFFKKNIVGTTVLKV